MATDMPEIFVSEEEWLQRVIGESERRVQAMKQIDGVINGTHKIVPVTATPKMLQAAWRCIRRENKQRHVLGPGPGFAEAFQALLDNA